MWKASLNKAVREVRFVLKSGPEHQGVWHFVNKKVPELRMLNPTTFFSLQEIPEELKTDSACYVVYGDVNDTHEEMKTAGMTASAFEDFLKRSVENGLTMERASTANLPIDIVEAGKYQKHIDDAF